MLLLRKVSEVKFFAFCVLHQFHMFAVSRLNDSAKDKKKENIFKD